MTAATDLVLLQVSIDDILEADPTSAEHALRTAAQRGMFQRLLDAPGTPPLNADPHAAALVDVLSRLGRWATAAQLARVAEAMRIWSLGRLWQGANLVARARPDLNLATALRISASGMSVNASLFEIVSGYHLEAEELAAPAVRALTEMARQLCAWDNDIGSWSKESIRGTADQHLVGVLAGRDGRTLEQAFAEAVALRNQTMGLFVLLREQTAGAASPALRRYLGELGLMIAAVLDFTVVSTRYRDVPTGSAVPIAARMRIDARSHEPDAGTAPAIPTIAWWWDCLESDGR
ncbi:terpene synthase family protein [Kitasatospora sp. NPDC127059]|uniref:terpene synthase family protein n=1 Tax=unclassified Kitasatospora TaxID=2633591 RepID=UPI0036569A1D